MGAVRVNHVSILANDLEESARFYEELFGLERLPTPTFPEPVLWLRLGDQQLHLFERPVEAPVYHHLAFDVEDFDDVYRRAKARGLLDDTAWGWKLRSHPTGWVQMYLRDPAGNLIEVDTPDRSKLAPDVAADVFALEGEIVQEGDAARATLYHAEAVGA